MSSTVPLLRVEGLSKAFGALQVLHDVSLSVARGEVVAIIGASGSGKSTLLRCINRLEEPNAGRIFLEEAEITARDAPINELRRHIGMVFQQFNLYPHLTALDNVAIALRKVLKWNKADAERRARDCLAQVGLTEKEDVYPTQLSGGQQQRVGIARALALEPRMMLFDEPTSALDPELVSGVLGVMRGMRDRGMTMIVVTHEMGFAREAADRVIYMDEGRIVEQGPPAEVLGAPKSPRLREFLANVLHR